jgi:hypothetical protein
MYIYIYIHTHIYVNSVSLYNVHSYMFRQLSITLGDYQITFKYIVTYFIFQYMYFNIL